jgi:RNA polymerase sigma-70 factor (ECF subfamily)
LDEFSERDLFEGLHRFDEQALGTVYDAYYLFIYRYLVVHTGHRETAEDLTQQTFIRLLDALQAGNGPHSYLKAWLFRAATNLIIDDARAAKHRNHAPLDDIRSSVDSDYLSDARIDAAQIRDALVTLHPAQRAVITMRFLGEMNFDEIAHALGLSVGAVKAHQHRGLTALRNLLNRQETP